jgi:hypothetical protein
MAKQMIGTVTTKQQTVRLVRARLQQPLVQDWYRSRERLQALRMGFEGLREREDALQMREALRV